MIDDRARSYDNVRPAFEDRAHEQMDISSLVLIITISIDNDVCSICECIVYPEAKSGCKTPVATKRKYVMHTAFFRNFHSPVGATVVDDKVFDFIDPRDFSR